uniref:PORR domain-containing protein n=1 Tax=Ananas comosus var. bracteatus TaxID=296719 RepID=A0A6V7P791_ANACO|nr:unnamed protein product [Ananas comosus var. bracteatus]
MVECKKQLSPIGLSFEAEAPSSIVTHGDGDEDEARDPNPSLLPSFFFFLLLQRRSLAVWSMKKDPALEAALCRNRRWIVNNQIKHLLLRLPSRVAPVRSLQRMYKTLDQRGRALNWLRKYPSCFDTFPDPGGGGGDGELFFGFTKRMAALVAEEEAALDASEPAMARRLAKLLMLARDRRIRVAKLGELKRALGLPDDYLLRLLPNHPDLFRLVNPYGPAAPWRSSSPAGPPTSPSPPSRPRPPLAGRSRRRRRRASCARSPTAGSDRARASTSSTRAPPTCRPTRGLGGIARHGG